MSGTPINSVTNSHVYAALEIVATIDEIEISPPASEHEYAALRATSAHTIT